MSYIDKSLGDGETIIARANFHWLYVTAAWALLLVPLVLAAGGLVPGSQNLPDAEQSAYWAAALVAICCSCWACSHSSRMMIRKWTTEIGVTSHRFVEQYGAAVHAHQ